MTVPAITAARKPDTSSPRRVLDPSQDPALSHGAARLAAALAARGCRSPHGKRVLARTLAAEIGSSVCSVGRYSRELESRGWLLTKRTGRSSCYRLQTALWQQVSEISEQVLHQDQEQVQVKVLHQEQVLHQDQEQVQVSEISLHQDKEQARVSEIDLHQDQEQRSRTGARSDLARVRDPQMLSTVVSQQQGAGGAGQHVADLLERLPERVRPEPNGAVRAAVLAATRGGWTVDLLASTLAADSARAAGPGYLVARLRDLAGSPPPTPRLSPAALPVHQVLDVTRPRTAPPADADRLLAVFRGARYAERLEALAR